MTLVCKTRREFLSWRNSLEKSVGFVPTMGALHEGHEALLRQCRRENQISVLSIYVNPTQFNNPEDLKKYPQSWEQDLKLAENCEVDAIFLPSYEEIYSDHYSYRVTEHSMSPELCGKFRPGHFEGMLTVVLKLFQIIRPQKAYFGEKDFQQLKLVEGLVESFFLDVIVCPVPTVRASNGLALSSRNSRLSPEARELASEIYKTLKNRQLSLEESKKRLTEFGFKVEYLEERWGRRLCAAELEGVRLIDNV